MLRISIVLHHLDLFKCTQSGSLFSVRKGTFFCYFLIFRLVSPFKHFIQLFFIKKTTLCASTEEYSELQIRERRSQIHYRRDREGPEGEWRFSFTLSLTSALDGVGVQRHASSVSPPRKRYGTHCTGGWVGPSVIFWTAAENVTLTGFDPRTVQPVASRYTDWATPPIYSHK